jgi:hypothetical protein
MDVFLVLVGVMLWTRPAAAELERKVSKFTGVQL